ncbi:MAG: hypothetical protein AAFP80_11895, partial [Pseudomonadota bacterium]
HGSYRAALEERTRERVPLDWAGTSYILGYTELLIAERTDDLKRAKDGAERIESAIPVLEEGGHAVWADAAKHYLGKAKVILKRLTD